MYQQVAACLFVLDHCTRASKAGLCDQDGEGLCASYDAHLAMECSWWRYMLSGTYARLACQRRECQELHVHGLQRSGLCFQCLAYILPIRLFALLGCSMHHFQFY